MQEKTFNINPEAIKSLYNSFFETDSLFFRKWEGMPDLDVFNNLVEISFWASLLKEEGKAVRFTIDFRPKTTHLKRAFVFDREEAFTSERIAKLSPILENDKFKLGVWYEENESNLKIWGLLRSEELPCLNINAEVAGKLTIVKPWKRAIITGDVACCIDDRWLESLIAQRLLQQNLLEDLIDKYLLEENDRYRNQDLIRTTIKRGFGVIARDLVLRGLGGTLLLVSSSNSNWQSESAESLPFTSVTYTEAKENFHKYIDAQLADTSTLRERDLQNLEAVRKTAADCHEKFLGSLKQLSSLMSVDGAAVSTYEFHPLAFGVKLKPKDSNKSLPEIDWRNLLENKEPPNKEPKGMRHQSAARFVFDHIDSIALVVSQDGEGSLFISDGNHNEAERGILGFRYVDVAL